MSTIKKQALSAAGVVIAAFAVTFPTTC